MEKLLACPWREKESENLKCVRLSCHNLPFNWWISCQERLGCFDQWMVSPGFLQTLFRTRPLGSPSKRRNRGQMFQLCPQLGAQSLCYIFYVWQVVKISCEMSHCSNNLCSCVALGTKQTAYRWGSYSWMRQQDSWEWNNAKECVSAHSQQPPKWSVIMLHPTHMSKTVVEGKMEWCCNTNVRPDNACSIFSNRALQGDKAAHFKAKVEAWKVTTRTEYDNKRIRRCRD